MKQHLTKAFLGTLLVTGALAVPAAAQEASTDDLKKDIDSIRETLKSMQKDLQDIKGMLQSRPGAPPVSVLLDLGKNLSRGEPTAKLTMVEFTDYQ